jgi:hypothetical protein
MIFARGAGAAVVLVTLTLSLKCGGMAAVIAWARAQRTQARADPFRHAHEPAKTRRSYIEGERSQPSDAATKRKQDPGPPEKRARLRKKHHGDKKIRVGIIGASMHNGWGRDAHIPLCARFGLRFLCGAEQLKAKRQQSGASAETEVGDAHETFGKHVQQEAALELIER